MSWNASVVPQNNATVVLKAGPSPILWEQTNGSNYAREFHGTDLFQVTTTDAPHDTNGHLYVKLPPYDIGASLELTNSTSQNASASNVLDLSSNVDNRSVILTRNVGNKEHAKLVNGEWHTYGDSIYSAHNPDDPLGESKIPLTISSSIGGNWSSNLSYLWSPQGFDTTETTPVISSGGVSGNTAFGNMSANMILEPGGISNYYYEYYGVPTGHEEITTTLKVTDNVDGAVAKSYYHLTLHDPVEMASSDITLDPNVTNYTIDEPYYYPDGTPIVGMGKRDENSQTIEIDDASSVEVGIGLKSTIDVKAFTGILGLSSQASYTSTHSFTVTSKTEIPKDIPEFYYRYLIALHPFERRHLRFYVYDADGEISRISNVDVFGNPVSPPKHIYHELFEDTALHPDARWSLLFPAPLDTQNLPYTLAPEPTYDYPQDSSGGSS